MQKKSKNWTIVPRKIARTNLTILRELLRMRTRVQSIEAMKPLKNLSANVFQYSGIWYLIEIIQNINENDEKKSYINWILAFEF